MKYTIITVLILVGSMVAMFISFEVITNKEQGKYSLSFGNDSFEEASGLGLSAYQHSRKIFSINKHRKNSFNATEREGLGCTFSNAVSSSSFLLHKLKLVSIPSNSVQHESGGEKVQVRSAMIHPVGGSLNDLHSQVLALSSVASDAGMQRVDDFPPPGDGDDGGLTAVPMGDGFWLLFLLSLFFVGYKFVLFKKNA